MPAEEMPAGELAQAARQEAEAQVGRFVGHRVSCVLRQGDNEWKCRGRGKVGCYDTEKGPVIVTRIVDEPECPARKPPRTTPNTTTPTTTPPEPSIDPEPSPSPSDPSAADDLAAIELGYRPEADNSALLRLTYLLDAMSADCPSNTQRQLADFTANTIRELESAGVDASPTEILEGVRQSSGLGAANDCVDLFALYTILRKEQG